MIHICSGKVPLATVGHRLDGAGAEVWRWQGAGPALEGASLRRGHCLRTEWGTA